MIFHTLCMQEAWNCRAAAPRTVAVRRLQESALSQLQSCQAAKLCFPIVNFRVFRVPNLPWKMKPQSTSRSLWRTMKCFVHHWSSLAGFHKCSRCLASPNKCDAPHHGDFANEISLDALGCRMTAFWRAKDGLPVLLPLIMFLLKRLEDQSVSWL